MLRITSGGSFKYEYKDKTFVTMTDINNELHGFGPTIVYKEGFNHGQYNLNFFEYNDAKFLMASTYPLNKKYWIYDVVIDDDSVITIMTDSTPTKYYTNKLTLTNKRCIWNIKEIYEFIISIYGSAIEMIQIDNKTDELYKIALESQSKSCCSYIANIKNQTDELCRLAIKKDPLSIRYIREPTQELCDYSVKTHPKSFEYIEDKFKTDELKSIYDKSMCKDTNCNMCYRQ